MHSDVHADLVEFACRHCTHWWLRRFEVWHVYTHTTERAYYRQDGHWTMAPYTASGAHTCRHCGTPVTGRRLERRRLPAPPSIP
ncbi:hypothetical protein BIV57_00990 [Mangrovactinospora gilvigrisea]|uniref:C2H2-type domain-containing protein n=1 Tax=Mangrovactinospora gilvigrisea TaxID=1428644 RepID=A0A1J7CII1_9ACTN|nr:hypothetical protein [Mangrovactinospora gilvigrisea]OIV39442.1 hypothetical protein BIV57_00990 [Mangrovactinospora gilvigrisea]